MSRFLSLALALACLASGVADAAEPLRVFIRGGVKTHGPDQHDHPRFLAEWTKLLNERGAKAQGALTFPTAEQYAATDVLVIYAPDPWDMGSEDRNNLQAFVKRGGGIVVLHDGICGRRDPDWVKSVVGGAWRYGTAKWFEGDVSLYYVNKDHPISAGAANFDVNDELYYDLDMDPAANVIASTWTPDQRAQKNGRAFPHIYDTAPQMWTFEKENYRAFVSLPGHEWKTFELPNYRAILLRGIAWAGKRDKVDELCSADELASLGYPSGGPSKPADSLAQAVLHPDFKMSLAATEPLINKPMMIDWDPQGRMWVAETPEYPNGRRGLREDFAGKEWKDGGGLVAKPGVQDRPGLDRISLLIDTDGDGVADKKTVFADGLDLVTGFVFHKDGVIVTQAPDILFLRDTDGDGRADKIEKLYTGLGTGDTHAVINNPRWGYDGWIYATHGYSSGDVTSGDGSKKFGRIGSGVVRFKPDGSALEQYSSKGGNTWGLTLTWDNEVMWTQPTSGDLLMHTVLPEHALAKGKVGDTPSFKVVIRSPKSFPLMTWEQQAYRQIDWVGSFTAAAGAAIYDGGTWPAAWNGNYFTTEPTINIVHHEILTNDGVSFAAHKAQGREETEFIGSKDLWFRPIENRVGPDGALYIVDFYNQAVIHNDTRGPVHNKVNAAVRPDRDHYFGRIWRVDHKQATAAQVPDLSKAAPAALVQALSHANQAVRMNAARLLVESGAASDSLAALVKTSGGTPAARVQALWILQRQGKITADLIATAVGDRDEAVSRNALRIVAENAQVAPQSGMILAKVKDADPRTRLAAILALGHAQLTPAERVAVVAALPELKDRYLESALFGVASGAPLEYLQAALDAAARANDPAPYTALVGQLAGQFGGKPQDAAKAVALLAAAQNVPATVRLKEVALAKLGDTAAGNVPQWDATLQRSLAALLESPVANSAVPLIAAWDKQGAMGAQVQALVTKLVAQLQDTAVPEAQRAQIISNLVSVRRLNAEILPSIARILGSPASAALQQRAIEELGGINDADTGAILAAAYPKLDPKLQDVAFAQLLKRPEWTRTLISQFESGAVTLTTFGPIALDKLRNHPDRETAKLASATIDRLRGPMLQQKDQVIAQLLSVVEQGGDLAKGQQYFNASCAVCHRFNGVGSNLAPELTGMGAHPRAELLTHIVDPNREVDPSFAAYNFETKKGEIFQGIIVRENAKAVIVRDAAGEHELAKEDLASRHEVGRSLMPEGFEALGGEVLRDMIAYLQSADAKYRIIDLRPAFTADSRDGLFSDQAAKNDSLRFTKTGDVKLGDVTFKVADPATYGRNLVVLKGGSGHSQTYPRMVEIPVTGLRAKALHFLGGIGGWAYPYSGEDLPVAKVTVVYEGGAQDEIVLKNGVEFADYIREQDVPGSELAKGLVAGGKQVRTFRKALTRDGVISKLILESYDNQVAPVFVAVTAEVGTPDPNAVAEAPKPADTALQPPANPAQANGPVADVTKARVLSLGGGSSHDFAKWFGAADSALLQTLKPNWLQYTEKPADLAAAAADLDVLYFSTNQPLSSDARKAIFDLANRGKGLLLIHAGVWHNWNNWPQYHSEIAGGGSRGHDAFGEFEVKVLDRNHPVTKGLPESFKITDELYYFEPVQGGAPIQVLAEATSPKSGKTFPIIWIVKHPTARIAGITLGHDGKAHDLPEYQTLLKNAFTWTATGK